MTYFGFLAIFLLAPIIVLSFVAWRDEQRGLAPVNALCGCAPYGLIALLVVIAVVWTTPWDNYLVATRVWWYDANLVRGVVLGWVPLEEYCFFVLQPIMTGLFTLSLSRRLQPAASAPGRPVLLRSVAAAATGLCAVAFWLPLLLGSGQLTYLSLELVWALPPITLQLAFGADILWQHRVLVFTAICVPTLYLAAADVIAIQSGTWTIDPDQSLHGFMLFGLLPLEELMFFTLTNVLVVFGLLLGMASASQERLPAALRSMINALPGSRARPSTGS